jgi:hypothetical protein
MGTTIRGELRCFNCARCLGDFESHPEAHGNVHVHGRKPEFRQLPQSGGRVMMEQMEKIAA